MKLLLGNNRSHGSLPGRNVYEGEDPGNAIHCLTKVELLMRPAMAKKQIKVSCTYTFSFLSPIFYAYGMPIKIGEDVNG